MRSKSRETIGKENDFTRGSVRRNILSMALPMMLAQIINVLYNIVDRMYIGRMEGDATLALTGVGLAFPIITIINAFANLFGAGGAPLCSIARGKGNNEEAAKIMQCSYSLLLISALVLTAAGYAGLKPLLYAFGASDATYPYASDYLVIYLAGTVFVMISLGLNSFINSQGFGKIGMLTVLSGAITNIILDPIFIFTLNMGVKGAALATIISQFVSALWVLLFLSGRQAILMLKVKQLKLEWRLIKSISALGLAGFTMQITNGAVQVACNTTLQAFGGGYLCRYHDSI